MRSLGKFLLIAALTSLTACQSFYPKAPALVAPLWQSKSYQRQDQVEIQWKQQSFSFLLYQQQQGENLSMVGLSLTGQVLFQLKYDGQKVKVEQRIQAMRLLPFDFLVRDILLASYPQFSQAGQLNLTRVKQNNVEHIYINQQHVLDISQQGKNVIQLKNLHVPYTIVFSPMDDALQVGN